MAAPISQGEADFNVPEAGKPCKTFYKIVGDLKGPGSKTPLLALHGGPGCSHDYMLPIGDLWQRYGIPVVVYDQLGNGNSTHLPERKGDTAFWTVDLFKRELANLITHLGIGDAYSLLGHSWGGMLVAEFATDRPKGLHRLIISNSPASMELWSKAAGVLRAAMPDVDKVLAKHEAAGTTDSKEYEQATYEFYYQHLCRVRPFPEETKVCLKAIEDDPTVYHTMNGPSEFHVIGSLKNWTIIDRLHKIDTQTLLLNGRYDEATDSTVVPYFTGIRQVKWRCLEKSAHMAMVEERDKYNEIVGDFLTQQ